MVILLASFHEFALFLKIVLWIAVPLILVSLAVTTILHYRQKKKNALLSVEHPELPPVPEVDSSIVAKLQKEVNHYKRRIRELQHALSFAKADPEQEVVEQPLVVDPVPEPIAEQATVPREAAWLQDLVAEQKAHLHFLQLQLESRIKAYHELEHQFREQGENLVKMTAAFEHASHLLDDSEANAAQLRIEKENREVTIRRLESSLQELQAQHAESLKLLSGGVMANASSMAHQLEIK